MRVFHVSLSAIGILLSTAVQTSAADLAGTAARVTAVSNVTGDNRPDQWRYRWANSHWWYWTPQNRWMVYDDKIGWVYPAASGGCTTASGRAVSPQAVVPGNSSNFWPGTHYNPRLGAFDYSPSDL